MIWWNSKISTFMARTDALERLISLTYITSLQDIPADKQKRETEYVADQIIRLVQSNNNSDGNVDCVNLTLIRYFDEKRVDEISSYIASNERDIDIIKFKNMPNNFQDMAIHLRSLADKGHHDIAISLAFYACALAEYELKDRLREGTEYDQDIHGSITLAISRTKSERS